MELSNVENELLKVIRELRPYEKVEVSADRNGAPDFYLVSRSQKITISRLGVKFMQ